MAVKEGEMRLKIEIGIPLQSLERHAKECKLELVGEINPLKIFKR